MYEAFMSIYSLYYRPEITLTTFLPVICAGFHLVPVTITHIPHDKRPFYMACVEEVPDATGHLVSGIATDVSTCAE